MTTFTRSLIAAVALVLTAVAQARDPIIVVTGTAMPEGVVNVIALPPKPPRPERAPLLTDRTTENGQDNPSSPDSRRDADGSAQTPGNERPVGIGAGIEKTERAGKPERVERPQKPEKPELPERPEKPELPERPAKPERPERPERPGQGG